MKQLFSTLLILGCTGVGYTQANTKLSNLVLPTAVNQALLPSSSNSKDLGSSSLNWRSLYLKGSWFKGSQRFLSNTGIGNTFLGIQSGKSNTIGTYNTAVGDSALFTNNTGYYNTAAGAFSLYSNTTGQYNTASGIWALYSNTKGIYNTSSGSSALTNNTTGNWNTALGSSALGSNTTGNNNTASGINSLATNTTGSYNTAFGSYALQFTPASSYNTAIGYKAGYGNNGWNNVFVGANTNVNGADYYNVVAIGQDVTCTASSQVRIGNLATSSYQSNTDWTRFSDGRYKKNIKDNVPGLAFINKLRPVTYNLDVVGLNAFFHKNTPGESLPSGPAKESMEKALRQREAMLETGFIAQEVEKAAREVNYDFAGVDAPKNANDVYGLRYSEFVVPLVKAVQELDSAGKAKDEKIAALEARLNKLEAMITHSPNTLTFNSAYLEQNTPNPVRSTTTIRYHLPENVTSVVLNITNAEGKLMKTITLNTGSRQVSLNTSAFAAGAYNYTLYVDGKQADTKRLVTVR